MRAAVIQTNTQENRAENIQSALQLIARAAERGAELAVLPEYVSYLGREEYIWEHAEELGGYASQAFAAAARQHAIWLLAGSIYERSEQTGMCYNTSQLFSPTGELAAVYRKIHLFDVDIATGSFRESASVVPGDTPVVAEVGAFQLGLSICYDLRFPELYRALALAGATILTCSAAFTTHTGKDHWEVLLRARAIENQCYVLASAQTGTHPPARSCYGHSMIIDPWGMIIAQVSDGEGMAIADLELERVQSIRTNLPSLANRRPEAYPQVLSEIT
jgi:deaminated glutathione amidase